jgi:hypothetical protein
VSFEGWPRATWQSLADVLECLDLVDDFHDKYPRAVQPQALDWAAAFQQRPGYSGWVDLMDTEEAQKLLDGWLEWVCDERQIEEGDEGYEELVVDFVKALTGLFPKVDLV